MEVRSFTFFLAEERSYPNTAGCQTEPGDDGAMTDGLCVYLSHREMSGGSESWHG